MGPLGAALHALQFAALRALDPDFYDAPGLFDADTLAWLYGTSLRDIILANTDIDPASLPGDLYVTPIPGALPLAATGAVLLAALRRRARQRSVS